MTPDVGAKNELDAGSKAADAQKTLSLTSMAGGSLSALATGMLAAAALGVFALLQPWHPPSQLYLDLATLKGESPMLGLISGLAGTVWFASAAIALFSALAVKQSSRFLLNLGLLTLLLAADDLFLIHDYFLPRYLGLEEFPMKIAYVVSCAAFAVHYRREITQSGWIVFAAAVVFLAASLAFDNRQVGGFLQRILALGAEEHQHVEDVLKTAGIMIWSSFAVLASARKVNGNRLSG